VAEGVGFEPTVRFPVRLISSQVPSTAQPPFLSEAEEDSEKVVVVDCERAKRRKGEWANGRGQSGWNTLGPARHAPWRCKRQTSESRLPLLNRSGLSGARLRKAYGAAGPRPSKKKGKRRTTRKRLTANR
jgi:hypothetical protein